MLTKKVLDLLNDQIQKEFYSSYLYLSMSAYFLNEGLDGFANWFNVQAQEEKDHAMLIYNYINRVDERITLKPIEGPPVDFDSIEDVLDKTLEHEKFVTASIYTIVDAALEARDHKTNSFLEWFVNEQVEEEENANKNITDYKLVKGDGKGIMLLDRELAARVYVPVTATTA